MTRQNHIRHNPTSEIDLPRLGVRSQKHPLGDRAGDDVQPEVAGPTGLRDRAILEVIYATGLRRIDIVNLKLFDRQPVCPRILPLGPGQ